MGIRIFALGIQESELCLTGVWWFRSFSDIPAVVHTTGFSHEGLMDGSSTAAAAPLVRLADGQFRSRGHWAVEIEVNSYHSSIDREPRGEFASPFFAVRGGLRHESVERYGRAVFIFILGVQKWAFRRGRGWKDDPFAGNETLFTTIY